MAAKKLKGSQREERISLGSETFHELASNARNEKEYEDLLVSQKDTVFPPGYVSIFKRRLRSPSGNGIPDLAFVAEDFSYWAFVEVELAHHSLESHVLPQIRIFLDAYYDEANAAYLASKMGLDQAKLERLLKGEPPKVYVISNHFDEHWATEIRRAGGYFFSIRLFRNPVSGHLAFLHDKIPSFSPSEDVVTDVKRDLVVPGFLEVLQPARLPSQKVDLIFEGKVMRWVRVDTGDTIWLKVEGSPPALSHNTMYVIVEEQGKLILKAKS